MLEACVAWIDDNYERRQARWTWSEALRAARRPKPPSLKQQAMEQLPMVHYSADAEAIVMKALKSLPDD
jgi:hypothetical protein